MCRLIIGKATKLESHQKLENKQKKKKKNKLKNMDMRNQPEILKKHIFKQKI